MADDETDDRPRRRRREEDEDMTRTVDDVPRRRRRPRDDDEDDGTGGLIPYKNPKALLAYYIGIFGFFLPLIGSVTAIVLGFQGLKYAKLHPRSRGQVHAAIGIGCGSLGALFYLFILTILIMAAFAK